MAKNKPYNISSKPVKKKPTRRSTTKKKELENTTRIRVDKDRLNDVSSLDTSFLEGRVDTTSKKKVLNSKVSNKKTFDFTIIRNIILTILVISLIVLIVLALMSHSATGEKTTKKKKKDNKQVVEIVDDNYLFVGDYHTNKLNFDDLDYHYNKICDDNYETSYLLDNLSTEVYRYNPSIVFIELGINDLNNEVEDVDIVTNLSEIIDGIKENRKYAKIYIESLYPINTEKEGFDQSLIKEGITNGRIDKLNEMIKELSIDKDVEYIDVYKKLIKDNNLNEEYTDNGVYLNDEGYEVVLNLLRKVVDRNGNK